MPHPRLVVAGIILWGGLAAHSLRAQFPPDTLQNIKVLASDLTPRQVIDIMRGFALGLGVRCQFCHVGEEGQPLEEFDFPSDEKVMKRKAREMIKMVTAINEQHLAGLEDRGDPAVVVTCETCHHGVSKPRRIQDILLDSYRENGVDSALAAYRALRAEYYGTAAYDFGAFTIPEVADLLMTRVARSRGAGVPPGDHPDVRAAIALLEVDLEFAPRSPFAHAGLGQAYRLLGDTTAALASFERALEIDPGNRAAQIGIQRLRGR